jgi:hypothetical protein
LAPTSGTLSKFGYQTFGESPSLTSGGRRLDPETLASSSQPLGVYDYRAADCQRERIVSPATCRANCGLSLTTPSPRIVKSAGSKTVALTKSKTSRSTIGRSGSMRSNTNLDAKWIG